MRAYSSQSIRSRRSQILIAPTQKKCSTAARQSRRSTARSRRSTARSRSRVRYRYYRFSSPFCRRDVGVFVFIYFHRFSVTAWTPARVWCCFFFTPGRMYTGLRGERVAGRWCGGQAVAASFEVRGLRMKCNTIHFCILE